MRLSLCIKCNRGIPLREREREKERVHIIYYYLLEFNAKKVLNRRFNGPVKIYSNSNQICAIFDIFLKLFYITGQTENSIMKSVIKSNNLLIDYKDLNASV